MLDARAICRLLLDDEQPVPPQPDDPNQLDLGLDPDTLFDPKAEIMRYANEPFRVRGSGPTDLYRKLEGKLAGRPQKKIGPNTYVVRHHDRLAVRFHQTDVVAAYPDGKVTVESGGWRPGGGQWAYGWRAAPGRTTMARMNDWLPSGWRIYSLKNEWFWWNYNGPRGDEAEVRYPYNDGDTIFPDGSLQLHDQPIPIKRRQRKV